MLKVGDKVKVIEDSDKIIKPGTKCKIIGFLINKKLVLVKMPNGEQRMFLYEELKKDKFLGIF